MARERLTAGRIAKLATDKGQAFLWDTESPGLAVRVTASGNKAFVFQGHIDGKTPRITIGDVKTWTLDEARAKANSWKAMIDEGKDPRKVIASNKATDEKLEVERIEAVAFAQELSKRESLTLAEAWSAYLKYIRVKKKDGALLSQRHIEDHLKVSQAGGEPKKRGNGLTEPGPLHSLLSVRLVDLTDDCIKEWLRTECLVRPTSTALAYRLFRACSNWMESKKEFQNLLPKGAVTAPEVRNEVPSPKSKKEDCLQREQLASWFAATRQYHNPVVSAYLQFALLTGARREEMMCLKWSDVDFKWLKVTSGDKVEDQRVFSLPPYLAHLLSGLPRRNEWVFSSVSSKSGHLEEPRDAHVKILHEAGLPHISIHGLRRSFGTLAEWLEIPTGVIAQIQGHKPSALAEKHYRRRPVDLLRKWHTKLEAWILEEAGVAFVPSQQVRLLKEVKNA